MVEFSPLRLKLSGIDDLNPDQSVKIVAKKYHVKLA